MNRAHSLLCALLAVFACGGCTSTEGREIPGSHGITIERCDEIVDNIPDHNPGFFIPDLFSKDFGKLMKEYQQSGGDELAGLLGGIGEDEFMWYWHSGNGDGFSDNAQKTYTLVRGSEKEADILLNMDEVCYDEQGNRLYELHSPFHLLLVKENGKWVLDDWLQTYGGNEWSSRKTELKEYLEEKNSWSSFTFKGHMLDENEPRPFQVILHIKKEGDPSGEKAIFGAFRFDDKEDDYYDSVRGTLDRDGKISLMVECYGNDHGFFGTATPDLQTISGDWQSYYPDGRIAIDREFVMEKRD